VEMGKVGSSRILCTGGEGEVDESEGDPVDGC